MSASSSSGSNPNSFLLAGFACPECASFGPFDIIERMLVRYNDTGLSEQVSLGFDDDSPCICGDCGHEGVVSTFRPECPDLEIAS
jgi:hypothetical protein